MSLQEANVLKKAARWPIPAEKRAVVITKLLEIVEKAPDPRDVRGAAAALIAADRLNQADEHHADPQQRTVIHEHTHTLNANRSRIAALADRLGIDFDPDAVAEGPGDGCVDAVSEPPAAERSSAPD